MKKTRKILSLALCILLLTAVIPLGTFPVAAAETSGNFKYTVSNGNATITGCETKPTGNLEIPATLDGYPVTTIGGSAFYGCTGLTSVTIPDSVTTIGNSAFSRCTGLTGVYISDLAAWCNISFGSYDANPLYYAHNLYLNGELVTDLVIPDSVTTIGTSAFSGCTGLTSVTIGNSVTTIGDDAFYHCTGLKSVTIPNSVTTIGSEAFYGCTGLTEINWNAKAVTDFTSSSNVFYKAGTGGDGITVTFGNTVEKIPAYLFYDSSYSPKIKSVTIGNSVTTIGSSAFYNCTGLTSVTIPNSVTTIGEDAFYCCYGLTSVTIPDSVTTIGDVAFSCCTGLTSITIPDSVTTIGSYAFSGCYGLTSVTIPDSVTTIGMDAFDDCPVTIYGFADSAAERYATVNSFQFVAMPEMIEIFTLPKTEYKLNEAFDPYHLIIMAYYSDGTAQLRYRGYEVTGFDSAKAGTQTVTVSYLGATTTFQVTVADGMAENPPTVEDLAHCSRAILGYEKPTEADDYNGDGVCDVRDLVRLKKMMAA